MNTGFFIQRMPFSERNLFLRLLAFTATGMILVALPAVAKPKAAPVQSATIINTGSTNTLGYTISVSSSGSARMADEPFPVTDGNISSRGTTNYKLLSKAQVKKFFADLAAAMPLTALPVRHGMRSASFGTQTYITYKGQKSPDLTFASDPRTAALKADIDAITKTLHVGNAPRRPIVIHADR